MCHKQDLYNKITIIFVNYRLWEPSFALLLLFFFLSALKGILNRSSSPDVSTDAIVGGNPWGVILIPRSSGVGLGTMGGCSYFTCEQTRLIHHESSPDIAQRDLSSCRFFCSKVAIALLLINPPCKSTLKEGWSFIHQRRWLKAALLFLLVSPQTLCAFLGIAYWAEIASNLL